jgi:hypothetical protein
VGEMPTEFAGDVSLEAAVDLARGLVAGPDRAGATERCTRLIISDCRQ